MEAVPLYAVMAYVVLERVVKIVLRIVGNVLEDVEMGNVM